LRRSAVAHAAIATIIAAGSICSVFSGEAHAGCGDGACGRVDWTEVTDMDQGVPAAAKLHGNYAWEASRDYWGSHPLAGTLSGYVWLTCLSPSGTNAVCRGQLAAEIAKAGTTTTVTLNGSYFDYDAGAVLRPAGLFAEGEPGTAVFLPESSLGGGPLNPDVCRVALGLPAIGGDAGTPDAAGGAGGNAGSGAGGGGAASGGAAGGTNAGGAAGSAPTSDDGGCSTSGRGAPAHAGFVAVLVVATMLELARRRSRD